MIDQLISSLFNDLYKSSSKKIGFSHLPGWKHLGHPHFDQSQRWPQYHWRPGGWPTVAAFNSSNTTSTVSDIWHGDTSASTHPRLAGSTRQWSRMTMDWTLKRPVPWILPSCSPDSQKKSLLQVDFPPWKALSVCPLIVIACCAVSIDIFPSHIIGHHTTSSNYWATFNQPLTD